MSRKTELAKNTLIIGLGKVSSQLALFFLLPLYTLYLSPSEYGFADLALTYVALLVPVFTIQLEMAAFRFLIDARSNSAEKTKIISNVTQIVLLQIAIFILASLLFSTFVTVPHFWLIIGVVVATIFSSILLQVARGLGNNKQFAIASTLVGLTTLAAAVIFIAALNFGIAGIFISAIIANTICAIYLFTVLGISKYIKRNTYDRSLQTSLRNYSLPLVPNGVSLWVMNVADRTIISLMIDVAATGIYAVASRFALALGSVFGIFTMSLTESLALHINAKDRNKYISETFNSSLVAFASMGLLVITLMPFVFPLIIGPNFSEALKYIPIMVLGAVFSSVMSFYGAIYIAKKLTKQVAITSILSAILNIILTVILISPLGLYGPALASVLSYLTISIIRHFDIRKYIKIDYNIRSILSLLVMYTFVLVAYYNLNSFALSSVVLALTCAFILLINRSEIGAVVNKLKERKK